MAIQISGCTVIDDSRNITNANNMCVGVVTMTGSTGDIETPGTITAGGLDFPLDVVSFSPSIGETSISIRSPIIYIAYNQVVEKATTGIGTTANITLRNSSGIGTVIETIGVSSTKVVINGSVVTISPVNLLPNSTNVYVVVDENAFNSTGGDSPLIDTYYFTTVDPPQLGDPYEGGYLICQASNVQWIIAPSSTEVSRTWYCRNDAVITASSNAACGDWFIPTIGQLYNPGYTCRTYWDSCSSTYYWSVTEYYSNAAWGVYFPNGSCSAPIKTQTYCARAFRCVTY